MSQPVWPPTAASPGDPSATPAPYPAADPTAPPAFPADPTLPPGPPPFWSPGPSSATPPGSGSDPLPPARPRWRRARRACVVAAVVGLLAAAGSAVVAVQSYREAGTPEAAVQAYFGALASGDAASALAAGAVPAGGRALVSASVLKATIALAPITDVRTGAVSTDGDAATVEVRYRLGGGTPQEVADTVALRRVDGHWRLARSAVPVSLSVDDAATWAVVPTTTRPFRVPTDSQLVFPGAVPVQYSSPLLEVAATSRVVRLASTENDVRVAAAVSEQGRAAATKTVLAALTACAAGGSGVDPFCPQPPAGRDGAVTLRQVPQSFHGQLQGTDRLQLDITVSPDAAGLLEVSGSVDVTGTWQVLDYDNVAVSKSGPTSLTFGGTVAIGAPTTVTWERA